MEDKRNREKDFQHDTDSTDTHNQNAEQLLPTFDGEGGKLLGNSEGDHANVFNGGLAGEVVNDKGILN
jgi:hypothetical protein